FWGRLICRVPHGAAARVPTRVLRSHEPNWSSEPSERADGGWAELRRHGGPPALPEEEVFAQLFRRPAHRTTPEKAGRPMGPPTARALTPASHPERIRTRPLHGCLHVLGLS